MGELIVLDLDNAIQNKILTISPSRPTESAATWTEKYLLSPVGKWVLGFLGSILLAFIVYLLGWN